MQQSVTFEPIGAFPVLEFATIKARMTDELWIVGRAARPWTAGLNSPIRRRRS
jgi:hypothetical protein